MIATCLGFASYGMLDGLGYFGPGLRFDQQVTFANINGLLLVMTICAAAVEVIVALSEHREASSPPPPRPDLRSHPR